MKTRLRALAIVVLLIASFTDSGVGQLGGAYRFAVTGVSSSDTVAAGMLVVSPVGFDLNELPDWLVSKVRDEAFWLIRDDTTPTVCFGFSRSQSAVAGREFYGGIDPYGFSVAQFTGDSVRIPVYQSPDASQSMVGMFGPERAEGRVHQRDFNRRETEAPEIWLSFRATRIGDADIVRCRQALEGGVSRPRGPAF